MFPGRSVGAGRLDEVLVAMIATVEQADSSLSFDSQTEAVGIGGTIGAKGTAGAVWIVDGVWRKPRAIATEGVAG